jgi:cell division protein FtsL
MSEKVELLDEVDPLLVKDRGVDFKYYLFVLLMISFVLLFAFPKIYIQEQIYFKSRKISKLQAEYDTLKEEHKIISASVEKIKFKNQILDTLF